jgi:multiple antibiotic resistance protein
VIWSDAVQFVGAILLMLGALLPVVNPLGDAPLFLKLTPGCDATTRSELARRIALYSFLLLLGSMLLGTFVLRLLGISIPVVQVAGGAVVSALGWKLIADNAKSTDVAVDPVQAKALALERSFAPLTMPLTIDAGVISVAITVGANHAHTVEHEVILLLAGIAGAGIIALIILLTYRFAEQVGSWIGRTGMIVAVRLSAFIMLCIGVGITWNGVKSLLAEVGIRAGRALAGAP